MDYERFNFNCIEILGKKPEGRLESNQRGKYQIVPLSPDKMHGPFAAAGQFLSHGVGFGLVLDRLPDERGQLLLISAAPDKGF
jgi:hypothetical protein